MKLSKLMPGSDKPKKKYVYRSAKDGRYVSRLYALLHPSTTVKEEVQ